MWVMTSQPPRLDSLTPGKTAGYAAVLHWPESPRDRFDSRSSPGFWMMKFRTVLGIAALLATAGFAAPSALAGTVKGSVKLPEGSRSTRLFHGYWRVENGNIPVQNAGGAKAETVVLLENLKGGKGPSARTVSVDLGGLDARPRLVVVGPGSVIEIKNTGKVRHELSTPDAPKVMAPETLAPGGMRRQRFDAVGGFVIRDNEYPHIMISVIVADTPFFAALDEKGNFSIPNVPDGKANLKVWTRGRWAAEQEIDTASKEDLTIKVAPPQDHDKEAKEAE